MPIKHTFVSAVTDDGDPDLVGPNEWNATHSGLDAWVMTRSSNQTLTSNAFNDINFDVAEIDSGESVVELANDRFVIPTTGLYIIHGLWKWETTVPQAANNSYAELMLNGSSVLVLRDAASTMSTYGERSGFGVTGFTAGDFLTMRANPGSVSGVVFRGSTSVHTRSKMTMVRIA